MEIKISTPVKPPEWALLERQLLEANAEACEEFHAKYFDSRGYLLCIERWGGNDGPDDAMESCVGWPLLHALGADNAVLERVHHIWEGHLKQYTEARTIEVPMAREGMYHKEFPVMFDWLHNGEGLAVFNLLGLSDPLHRATQERICRYAGFYMNEDPEAPNYDPEHKIIRSMMNGSRGPLLRPATALDWAGDPIEVGDRFHPLHGERNYEEMLAHFKDYNDIVGDHPSNLAATTLALNAYMLTQKPEYKRWLLEYVDAWAERMEANNGIIPSKIGLDGVIGGPERKWYAGVYGWGFSVIVPQTGELAHRTTVHVGILGFLNAYLLTGESRYLDLWGKMLDTINAQGKEIDGVWMYPQNYGDQGWYNYQPYKYAHGAMELWYLSLREKDRKRLPDNDWPVYGDIKYAGNSDWPAYLAGRNPDYPRQALLADIERVQQRLEAMRADQTTPDTRLSDDTIALNPCSIASLISLMLGGITPAYWGGVLHCHVRYFDSEQQRAGLPPDVGALVEKLSDTGMVLTLVNLSQTETRTVILQAGGYAEHQFLSVLSSSGEKEVNAPHLTVRLEPGAGELLTLGMRRYVNQPTLAHPWHVTTTGPE